MDRTLTFRHKGDYLAGSFFQQTCEGQFETIDPSTGVVLDRVPWRVAAVDAAVSEAREAVATWSRLAYVDRAAPIVRLRQILEERRGRLAAMIARELGKPNWEATLECAAAERSLDLLLEQGNEILQRVSHPTSFGSVQRLPLGVAAVVTPYPYPVYGPVQLLLPCLLGGNAVVWNPSSRVPLVSQMVAMAIDSARFPAGVVAMVQGPRAPIGERLVRHVGVDLVAGAGSPEMADQLRSSVGNLRPISVQTGGKGWAIVCADADLDRAAYEVVSGAYLSAGQRCNATSRVVVERPVARPFLTRVVALMRGLKVGPPSDRESFCGPLVDDTARRRFQSHLRNWGRAGIEFPVEGGPGQLPPTLRRKGQCYVAPALALLEGGELPGDITPPEEVEGPLLLAQLTDSAEDATDAYNRHPYGLSAAIFTADERRFASLAGRLQAGAVNWNRGTIVASARFPNVGLGRSGLGAEGNAAMLYACTYAQSRLGTSGRFDPSHRVPGMAWPSEMGVIDPSSMSTPPFRPGGTP